MLAMRIEKAGSINGTINLPGDKSISHRAAMLAAISTGETKITNFASGADCRSTLTCLKGLGVEIIERGSEITVKGFGRTGLRQPVQALDCGNSGTTMRLLAGILAGQPFESILTGDRSLLTRPMTRIVEPLSAMGAVIGCDNDNAPLTIAGRHPLKAIDHETSTPSAQVKSCILLAGLNAVGATAVTEPVKTRDHTERMLRWFGCHVKTAHVTAGHRTSIRGGQELIAKEVTVAPDISSAAFFISAAVCLKGSDLTIQSIGMNPTRRAFVDILIDHGANIEITDEHEVCNEPIATVRVRSGLPEPSRKLLIDGGNASRLIDEIPILAVLGSQLDGGMEIRDGAELRVKETDRISAIVENLRRMNGRVVEYPDGLKVGRSSLTGASIDPFGDHRIAMAFAIAGLFAKGETIIDNSSCVDVSFPGFFETLRSVIR